MIDIKVLLIEDDDIARERLKNIIKKEGYKVCTASNGVEGLEVFRSEKPDLVVTDVKMPKMDGMEVTRRIKSLSPETGIVLITGHGSMDMVIEALRGGATDYIKKPINVDEMLLSLGRATEFVLKKRNRMIKKSILVVEDNDKSRETLVRVFAKEGYEVYQAADGIEAVRIFFERKIDVVLLDIKLPGKDGLDVLKEISGTSRYFETIVMSGYGDEVMAVEAMRNGAMNFIRKPIDLEQLLVSVQKAYEKLNLQRAYYYAEREIDISRQIIDKISLDRDIELRFPIRVERDFFMSTLDDLSSLNKRYFTVDKDMKVGYVSSNFLDRNHFKPQILKSLMVSDFGTSMSNTDKLESSLTGFLCDGERLTMEYPIGENQAMNFYKVYLYAKGSSSAVALGSYRVDI
ncbi:Response regulator receiver domain-containing protein [Dethiosulfatibacter aminovorans DSM 17477]|uniref:Response regulator receiver domain-containing protein n=1 Tax=Dethiosulfatibacter aminovorans DSM 17477 TaxID=1121476 RepID=A0A1M6EFG4_9FIRM|nr:response regulator [Dethiosulfatibacter aminovorans]SHI84226.1 Response regulator receiver domain-containing protein [Dethiosulfatibacter aminovorans DSM 17477]